MNKLRILCVPALMTSLLMGCAQTNAASNTTNMNIPLLQSHFVRF